MSSIFELQTQIEIAFNLNLIHQENFEKVYEQTREVERMLSVFISKIEINS